MTNRQMSNIVRKASFANNIGKLKQGCSTRWVKDTPDGEVTVCSVKCLTKGERPRKFAVSSACKAMPSGYGYTYKTIMSHLLDDQILA